MTTDDKRIWRGAVIAVASYLTIGGAQGHAQTLTEPDFVADAICEVMVAPRRQ